MRSALALVVLALVVSAAISGCGGTGSATSSSAPSPTRASRPGSAVIATDAAYLRSQSLTVDSHIVSQLRNRTPLYVFHGVCTGSADGHCQAVAVFVGGGQKPTWLRQYVGVRGMSPVSLGFSITAVSYASQDPLCCPSLPDVTDTYTWDGTHFVERGPLPHKPGQ